MPLVAIILPAVVMLAILWKLGWLKSVRDMWISLFTGFIMVYLALTIIGAAIRGGSQKLVPPWKVPNLEDDPSIQRQYCRPASNSSSLGIREAEIMPDENVEEAKPAPEAKAKAVVPASGGGRTVAAAGASGPAVVVVQAPPAGIAVPQVSRRKVLLIGFWTGMGAMVLGIVVTILNSIYPRGITGFGTTIAVGAVESLTPGKKLHNLDAKAWIVRFNAEQAAHNPPAVEGAVMALYHRCVHLGCTVPYREDFSFEDPRNGQTYPGWFRCPCHGSTYSDAGVRVFGPAPRSLDTFDLSIDSSGIMQVNTGKISSGNETNPSRAILPG